MKVGDLQIVPILDGHSYDPIDTLLVHESGDRWDCPEHPLDARGRIEMTIGGFLIKTGKRTILVDTGIGPVVEDDVQCGSLPQRLQEQGVHPADVTDVLFTHLHHDHVGWATQRDEVFFPRATFRVHEADWEHFVSGSDPVERATRKLGPIEPRLETFSAETQLAPGVFARPAPGHTPGSTIFLIESAGERALLLGDVVHGVSELTDPEWRCLYDVDPDAAGAAREQIASELTDSGTVFAPAHFPDLRFGRLVTSKGRRCFQYA
ncbi:MBL fold metallo-hydrolase [Saccharopolyspora mangrovi]|uniref:MBL fold metallo-hydrolase n=1 Tax=Saccharopolyspora mangrovi TaxID=3082379 RepID=A0ABU6AKQ8_9PSEU|nr:MBL fold metallo-hydrolase [Saccharopolyspora sp. S2-29]MEB3371895.1 MBL fold metallo-hydrolase [Saccharopolyspora sp. S2-29]